MADKVQESKSSVNEPVEEPAAKNVQTKTTEAVESKSTIGSFLKTNFDPLTLMLMLKASLPPVVVLGFYQSDTGAKLLGTLGYLSAIISILTLAMQPRAKFLANLFANVLGACIAAAMGTLIVYAAVKARLNTTPTLPPGVRPPAVTSLADVPYNSSASAVSAVFFFFSIYLANVLRAKLPQVVFAVMIFSIITTVVCAEAPKIPTVAFALTFITTLLKAFLFGMAIGAAVSLIVIPVSCRMIVIKQFTAYLDAMQKGLDAHKNLFESLQEKENIFTLLTVGGTIPAVDQVKATVAAISELNSKLQVDLPFAKREAGFGKLGGDEMKQLNKLGRLTMLPILGLASVSEVLQRFAISRGWRVDNVDTLPEEERRAREQAVDEWAHNFKLVHEQFSDIIDIIKDGFDHVAYQLQLKLRPKQVPNPDSRDVEGAPDKTAPGEPGFAQYLDEKSTKFYSSKHLMLTDWARSRGFQFSDDFFNHPHSSPVIMSDELKNASELRHQVNQRQVFLLLYMEFLLHATARSLLDLVNWTDKLVESGILKRNRLIIPNFKRIRKLFGSTFSKEELATDQTELGNLGGSIDYTVQLGSAFGAKKDPEHLPPKNDLEKAGNILRGVPRFFKSDDSAFGFRVACASISIGIILFLERTQKFAFEYRLLWAVIMTAISMSPTAGQSSFGFVLRVLGTFLAMLFSWFIWFVPGNGKTPGVIVLYWLFTFLLYWIPLKKPQFAMVGVITIVTITLTIGYQLEKNKIGEFALSASSGQVYLSALVIGPVRLATVTAGLFVAFVWTIFPYPTEEHSIIRRDAAAALHLLATFQSIVLETVGVRIRQMEGNLEDKNSAGRRLESARLRTFDQQVLLLNSMKQNTAFQKWEFSLGGRFPSEKYEAIVQSIESITRFMSLISYASAVFRNSEDGEGNKWREDFRKLLLVLRPLTHENVATFSLLSASMLDSRPLPPYFPKPKPFALVSQMEALDPNILSINNINEPGFAAFAVITLASRCVGLEVEILIDTITDLVGTLDFSIRLNELESERQEEEGEKAKAD